MNEELIIKLATVIASPFIAYYLAKLSFTRNSRIKNSESLFQAIKSNNPITAKEAFESLYGKGLLDNFHDIKLACQRNDFPELIECLKNNKITVEFKNENIQYRWNFMLHTAKPLFVSMVAAATTVNIALLTNLMLSEGEKIMLNLILFFTFYFISIPIYKSAIEIRDTYKKIKESINHS